MVSLDLASSTLSLAELADQFGWDGDVGSRDKDDLRDSKGNTYGQTVWRLEAGEPDDTPLDRQLHALDRRVREMQLPTDAWPPGAAAYVSIGVLCDTSTCTTVLTHELVKLIGGMNANLEITPYPTDFTDGDE